MINAIENLKSYIKGHRNLPVDGGIAPIRLVGLWTKYQIKISIL